MSRSLVLSLLLVGGVPSIAASRDAVADTYKPHVSIIAARKVALGRVPGTIVNEKLKTKKDKPPTWSIKIRPRGVPETSDRLTKVEIDAETGAILKVKDVKARKQEDE